MGDSLRSRRDGGRSGLGEDMEPRRFRALPSAEPLGHRVPVARGALARLLGLALLSRERAGPGLLIPRCSAIHSFGMRFPIDVVFLDGQGRPLRRISGLAPGRVAGCRGAAAVLEVAQGTRSTRAEARVTATKHRKEKRK